MLIICRDDFTKQPNTLVACQPKQSKSGIHFCWLLGAIWTEEGLYIGLGDGHADEQHARDHGSNQQHQLAAAALCASCGMRAAEPQNQGIAVPCFRGSAARVR